MTRSFVFMGRILGGGQIGVIVESPPSGCGLLRTVEKPNYHTLESAFPVATASTTETALFEPIEFAGVRFRNRVVMAPMGSGQADEDGFVTDQSVAYYRRRAAGGVGGITVEAALVTPESHGHEPRLHGP